MYFGFRDSLHLLHPPKIDIFLVFLFSSSCIKINVSTNFAGSMFEFSMSTMQSILEILPMTKLDYTEIEKDVHFDWRDSRHLPHLFKTTRFHSFFSRKNDICNLKFNSKTSHLEPLRFQTFKRFLQMRCLMKEKTQIAENTSDLSCEVT